MRNPWAREYARTPDRYIWGKAPSAFAKELAALVVPRGGRILDLGCGEGRDSVYFASRGFEVTGVDASAAGLEKAHRLAAESGVEVQWLRRSMLDLPVTGRFDLVYSCGSIHHVPRELRGPLFRRLKVLTRPEGVHAHIVFTDARIHPEKGEKIDYFSTGELAAIYADWRVLQHEGGAISCSQDGTRHVHSVERIIAARSLSERADAPGNPPPRVA